MNKQVRNYKEYTVDFITSYADYYTWVDDALVKVEPIKLLFNYDKETDKYYTRVEVRLPNKIVGTATIDNLYSSIPMFEKGIPVDSHKYGVSTVIFEMSNRTINSETGEYWSFIKEEPKQQFLRLDEFSYRFGTKWESPDYDNIKDNCYKSKAECLKFNSYKYTTSENKTYIKEGCNKAIMLDFGQRELVNKLEVLLKEIRNSGVRLVFDATENVYAYNIKNLENWEFTYNSTDCSFIDNPTDDLITDRLNDCYKLDSNIEYYGEDTFLIALTKYKKVAE